MGLTPNSIVAAMGRGVAFPMRFVDGGVAWNMARAPAVPTFDELRAAARGAIRAVARIDQGALVMSRDEGTLYSQLKGHSARKAIFDAGIASIQEAVRREVSYVEQARVTGQPPASGDYDGTTGKLTVRVGYQFARSIDPVSDDVELGSLGQAEALNG